MWVHSNSRSPQPAVTCSANFPVTSYNISLDGRQDVFTVPPEDISDDVIMTSLTAANGVRNDARHSIAVEACSVLSESSTVCRQSGSTEVGKGGREGKRCLESEDHFNPLPTYDAHMRHGLFISQ